jgi:hypothetical protein
MCKDGKCQERGSKSRPAIVSLGRAARDMAVLTAEPHMVIDMDGYVGIGRADPNMLNLPGLPIIISVDPATTDEEIERKADQFIIRRSSGRASAIMDLIAVLVGSPPAASDRSQPAPQDA